MKKLIFTFLLLALFSFKAGDYRSVYQIPEGVRSISTTDFNLDGNMDIITGHQVTWTNTDPSLAILKNIQNGIFEMYDSSISFCGTQHNIFSIKMDNDEYPDIVTFGADFSSGTQRFIRIFYNNNGYFSEYKDFTLNTTNTFTYISYGNVNDDEYPDILVLSNQYQFWGILYNDGEGNLSEPEYYDVIGDLPHKMACADFDGNGRDDVVITGQNTRIYYSKPEGFEAVVLEKNYPKDEVYLVDFDHDGEQDIITFGCFWGYTYSTFFENTGNQTFSSHTDFSFQIITSGNTIADFNNDSLPDVLFYTDSDKELLLFYNTGNFKLGQMNEFYPVSLSFAHFSCYDFDGNGYQDIGFAADYFYDQSYVTFLFNDGAGNFQNDPVVGLTEKNKQLNIFSISPNPFHDHTTVTITLPETGRAEVIVYDPAGRKIKCITHQQLKGGETCRFTWDGTGADQQKCRPGIYLASLVINGKQRQTVKVIIK